MYVSSLASNIPILKSSAYSLAIESANHAVGCLPRLKHDLSDNHRDMSDQVTLNNPDSKSSKCALDICDCGSWRKVLCLDDAWAGNAFDCDSAGTLDADFSCNVWTGARSVQGSLEASCAYVFVAWSSWKSLVAIFACSDVSGDDRSSAESRRSSWRCGCL